MFCAVCSFQLLPLILSSPPPAKSQAFELLGTFTSLWELRIEGNPFCNRVPPEALRAYIALAMRNTKLKVRPGEKQCTTWTGDRVRFSDGSQTGTGEERSYLSTRNARAFCKESFPNSSTSPAVLPLLNRGSTAGAPSSLSLLSSLLPNLSAPRCSCSIGSPSR